ncbi:hypothetical protein D3C76_1278620 [compost metagenome]
MLFQFAKVIGFDFSWQQVNRACNMAFAEIVTLTQIDNHCIFFIDKTRGFAAGDHLHFRGEAFERGEKYGCQ